MFTRLEAGEKKITKIKMRPLLTKNKKTNSRHFSNLWKGSLILKARFRS